MKRLTFLWLMLSALILTSPAFAVDRQMVNSEAKVTMNDLAQQVTIGDMIHMSAKEFTAQTGQKLSLKQKIGYGLMKGQMKKAVKKGTVSANAPASAVVMAAGSSFNFGAFLLGLFFGLLGVLIVAIAFDDRKAWVSALIGFGAFLLLYILLIASLF